MFRSMARLWLDRCTELLFAGTHTHTRLSNAQKARTGGGGGGGGATGLPTSKIAGRCGAASAAYPELLNRDTGECFDKEQTVAKRICF